MNDAGGSNVTTKDAFQARGQRRRNLIFPVGSSMVLVGLHTISPDC